MDRDGSREGALSSEDETDRLPGVRRYLRGQAVSGKAAEIILSSWRGSTKKQYRPYLRKWFKFCSGRCQDPLSPPVGVVLDFFD